MAARKPAPSTYLDGLLAELGRIATSYETVLSDSAIVNIDPNRHHSGIAFIGYAQWGWTESSNSLESARMDLLRQVRDWEPRFRLLFPHPTPSVSKRLDEHIDRLARWLVRPNGDRIPSSVQQAASLINASVATLRGLGRVLEPCRADRAAPG